LVPQGASPLALGPTAVRPVLAGGQFVAGAENRLLLAVLQRLCGLFAEPSPSGKDEWGHLVSPLVLVAPTGCGKSHLAEGLAHLAGSQAQLTTAADLRRGFAEAIDQGTTRRWRDRWAGKPLLVVDDIDHMAPSAAFQ